MLLAKQIKEIALQEGFDRCGIARARNLKEAKKHFEQSIHRGYHASMLFLEREVDKRFDPSMLLPNCKSVVVVTYNYTTSAVPASNKYRTARYTWIQDYHRFMKEQLQRVIERIQQIEPCQCRATVDSSCISEKNWAVEAGVGVWGKNGVIHNEKGSFFVLGTILIDTAVDFYDSAKESDCGTCQLCVQNCPAHALDHPYSVEATRCYAFHTIENKNLDNEILENAPLLFGCDICQEVCPKNKKNQSNSLNETKSSLFLRLQNEEFEHLTREAFKRYFGDTAIARRKFDKFYCAIEKKSKTQE